MTDEILTWSERLGEEPSTVADTFGAMDSEIHDLRAYVNLLEKQLKDASVAAIAEAAEVDRLTQELGDLPEAQADKLATIKAQRRVLEQALEALNGSAGREDVWDAITAIQGVLK